MPDVEQDKPPNFRGETGKLYLVRCFACSDSPRGRENYALAVADGTCAWCGWSEATPERGLTMPNMGRADHPVDYDGPCDCNECREMSQ